MGTDPRLIEVTPTTDSHVSLNAAAPNEQARHLNFYRQGRIFMACLVKLNCKFGEWWSVFPVLPSNDCEAVVSNGCKSLVLVFSQDAPQLKGATTNGAFDRSQFKRSAVPVHNPDSQAHVGPTFDIDARVGVAECKACLSALFSQLTKKWSDCEKCRSCSYPSAQSADPLPKASAIVLTLPAISMLGKAVQPDESCQRPHETKRQPERHVAVLIPTHERMRSTSSPSLARAAA